MHLSGGTHLSPVLKGELQVCLAHEEGELREAPPWGPRHTKSLVQRECCRFPVNWTLAYF